MNPHPAPATPDLMAEDIAEAVAHLEDGRVTLARQRLSSLWLHLERGADAAARQHRSAVAHWRAATETDAGVKLVWDERALAAAEAADPWTTPFAGTAGTLARRYPQLHLELARDHVRLDDSCGALDHLVRARQAAEALPADLLPEPARRRLLADIGRVDRKLAGGSGTGPPAPDAWEPPRWSDPEDGPTSTDPARNDPAEDDAAREGDSAGDPADDRPFGPFPW